MVLWLCLEFGKCSYMIFAFKGPKCYHYNQLLNQLVTYCCRKKENCNKSTNFDKFGNLQF